MGPSLDAGFSPVGFGTLARECDFARVEKMIRYIGPQLKQTYDAVVRKLMPWRMIDALSSLDEAGKRVEDRAPDAAATSPSEPNDDDGAAPPSMKA